MADRRTPNTNELARQLRELNNRVRRLEGLYDGRAGASIELPLGLGEVDVDAVYILEIGGAGNVKVTHASTGISTKIATPTGHPEYPDNDLRSVIAGSSAASGSNLEALINAVAALGTP